jgi:hypothetical protein
MSLSLYTGSGLQGITLSLGVRHSGFREKAGKRASDGAAGCVQDGMWVSKGSIQFNLNFVSLLKIHALENPC